MNCEICSTTTNNVKELISHLRLIHGEDEAFSICCPLQCTQQVFTTFGALSSHIYRKHRNALNLDNTLNVSKTGFTDQPQSPLPMKPAPEPQAGADKMEEAEFNHDLDYDVAHLLGTDGLEQEKESAGFLLKLRTIRSLSQIATLEVIDGTHKMFERTISRAKAVVKEGLHKNGLCSEVEDLDCALDSLSPPYQHLETIHKQDNFFRKHFSMLEPEEVCFSDRPFYVNRFSGQKRQKVQSQNVFYYVNFLRTLEVLLSNTEVFNEVNSSRPPSSKILDYCDGTMFQENKLFLANRRALQIVAYYDEVEVCNPIGSYVKKHSLGCLFFSLGNIRPCYRSSFKSIFLVAIGKHEDITEYGIDHFLRPFVEDLKTLYCDGITVGEQLYKGALVAFLADTKAAHQLGGFKESMSFAHRICRSCMATTGEAQRFFKEEDCSMRTPEEHFEFCQKLSGIANDQVSVHSGINRLSILEEVPEFSVVKDLPQDFMHDIFEGVAKYELKYFFSHCLDQKYFTISELNRRIVNFDFIDKDKPALIDRARIVDPQKSIRQNAGQMKSLLTNLPILLGDLIPIEEKHWHSVLILIKITQILLSWCYCRDSAVYMKVLVEEKLSLLKELYPHNTLKPKMHYLVHYATQMERFGPLLHTWTMRYEAKLAFTKRSSRRGNFKNICKTVARHHQLWFCYNLSVAPHLLYDTPDIGPTISESSLCSEPEHIQRQFRKWCPSSLAKSTITHHRWLKIQSTTYKIGHAVILEWSVLSPTFGKICDVLSCDDVHFLLVEVYTATQHSTHFNSYVLEGSSQVVLLCTLELFDYHCHHIRKSFKRYDPTLYICMSYHPCES